MKKILTCLILLLSFPSFGDSLFEGNAICYKTKVEGNNYERSMIQGVSDHLTEPFQLSNYRYKYYAKFKKKTNEIVISVLKNYADLDFINISFKYVDFENGSGIFVQKSSAFYDERRTFLKKSDDFNEVIILESGSDNVFRVDSCYKINEIPSSSERAKNWMLENLSTDTILDAEALKN